MILSTFGGSAAWDFVQELPSNAEQGAYGSNNFRNSGRDIVLYVAVVRLSECKSV